jgi:CRISPR-associated protein Csb1
MGVNKAITHDLLMEASRPGGASCLTSVTELEPAAGRHASVAPAKFASADKANKRGEYAYEKRYLDDGKPSTAVIIDSKQSQLNRCEAALALAIADEHSTLVKLPRVEVTYIRDGIAEVYSDLTLPHRIFDGHIRAGTVDGVPVTQLEAYRAVRNAGPGNARAVLDTSPVSLVFGSWDSSRSARQGRWRSTLTGEIIGFCADDRVSLKGGARVDPVGMQVKLNETVLKEIAGAQRAELTNKTYEKASKSAKEPKNAKDKGETLTSASMLGLGGIPPTLDALSGVACSRIVRSHVLSFAALRQMRFGAGPDGDAACRALLAALALNALTRSDTELCLRANCDLRESGPACVEIDQRGGTPQALDPLTIEEADALLDAALRAAQQKAGVHWNGAVLNVAGNPAIAAGAVSDEDEAAG